MPASFQILPEEGVVYVRYQGVARMSDTMKVFGEYLSHPDCKPGQKHLVDCSEITDWEENYVELMAVQAHKASAFMGHAAQTLIVYYAPDGVGRTIAELAIRSWEPFPSVVPVLQDTEAQALAILGLPFDGFASMLERG